METAIVDAISGVEVIGLLALAAANFALSVTAALARGVFSFRKVANFIPTRLAPMVGYCVIAALANLMQGWAAVAVATYAGLVTLYGAGILAALRSLTGLRLPDSLTEKDRGK